MVSKAFRIHPHVGIGFPESPTECVLNRAWPEFISGGGQKGSRGWTWAWDHVDHLFMNQFLPELSEGQDYDYALAEKGCE